jgi:peptide deformylase
MEKLKILTINNPEEYKILRETSEPVSKEELQSNEFQELIDQMLNIVKTDKRAGGLAAIQVGKKKRLFISEILDDDYKNIGEPIIFINPEVEIIDFTKILDYEGCLSIPKEFGQVYRYNKIRLKYLDRFGVEHKDKFNDYTARIVLHEYDHLDGILFIDKLAPGTKLKKENEI